MRYSNKDLDIEAWVEELEDGQRFDEYLERQSTGKKTVAVVRSRECYLECEEGKSFRIRLQCTRPCGSHPAMDINVTIDGRKVIGKSWFAAEDGTEIDRMYVDVAGVVTRSELQFAPLDTTEEEEDADIRGDDIGKLGRIEISIRKGDHIARSRKAYGTYTITDSSVGSVHEKEMKLGSTVCSANLTAVKRPNLGDPVYDFVQSRRDPLVCRFVWKHDTEERLEVMGIIPTASQISRPSIQALPARNRPPIIISPSPPLARRRGLMPSHKNAVVVYQRKRFLSIDSMESIEVVEDTGERTKVGYTGTGSEDRPIVLSGGQPIGRDVGASGGNSTFVIDMTDD